MNGISYKKIALIGLGLIASSIALSARRSGFKGVIEGYDISQKVMQEASDIGFCNKIHLLPGDAVRGADLVILCVPVGAMAKVGALIAPHLAQGSTLIDVGSVKQAVIAALLPHIPEHTHFVPTHPLAGTEYSGPRAGFAELFDNRWCIITPLSSEQKSAGYAGYSADIIGRVEDFWKALGAHIVHMDAAHHDLVLAVTSHVPHLIAYTIVGVADDIKNVTNTEIINYSAAGFRDFTRIAASDPTMWRDVFLNNKKASFEVLRRFKDEISLLEKAIEREDGQTLFDYFTRTKTIRKNILEAGQDSIMPDFGRLQKSLES